MFESYSALVDSCPTPFHFMAYARSLLLSSGFTEVHERLPVPIPYPRAGFVIRDERSLFAWRDCGHSGLLLTSSHCDSPCFILKLRPECPAETISRLRCSSYGGGLWYSWVDHPLRLAGQVIFESSGKVKTALYDSKTAFGLFPSTAIHFRSSANLSPTFNLEDSFVATYGTEKSPNLLETVAGALGTTPDKILYSNLRFVSAEHPTLYPGGLVSSPRLDDLCGSFATLTSFINAQPPEGFVSCLAVFDTEEIGALTKNGALSAWIDEGLSRIADGEELRLLKERAVAVNVDVGHAAHPNWLETNDHDHQPIIGGGILTERDPNEDVAHPAYIALCDAVRRTGRKLQFAAEPEVVASSGDDGRYILSGTGISLVDVGTPTLAMHGIRELGSIRDIEDLVAVLTDFYSHPPVVLE
jgi:aspartyl aminopeptidase